MGTQNLMFGDNMDLMRSKPDKFWDLAIVDPNYGIGADNPSIKPKKCKQKNGSVLTVNNPIYVHKQWDNKAPEKEYFDELLRVSKHQIIFGVNYFNYPLVGGRIVWDKINGNNDQFGCEIAYCSLNNRTDIVRYMWSGMFQGIVASKKISEANIQQGNKKLNQKRIHPTEKPIILYKWILENYAKQGQKILDTHGGSFSHAIAAYDLGFDLDIIENDIEYFNGGKERFNQHVLACETKNTINPTLF